MWSKKKEEEVIKILSTRTSGNGILLPNTTTFSKAVQHIGIILTEEEISNEKSDHNNNDIITTKQLKRGQAAHPGNSKLKLNDECITKLIHLYEKGKDKSTKLSSYGRMILWYLEKLNYSK